MDAIRLPRTGGRGGPPAAADNEPLTLVELAAIWRALPEKRRFSFVLTLDEAIADKLIEYTAQCVSTEDKR